MSPGPALRQFLRQTLLFARRPLAVASLLGLLAGGLGCDRRFFKATGYVASDGGELGRWHAPPDACGRDPFDGKSLAETNSIATFVWEDPSLHDPMRDEHRAKAADQPARLELARHDAGFSVAISTVKGRAAYFVSQDCAVLGVKTSEESPAVPGARSSLAGRLQMDCQTPANHVTADMSFQRCEF